MRPGINKIKPKSPFSQKIKDKILKRDNYQCQWCNKKQSDKVYLAVDHMEPEHDGGQGTYEN